MNSDDDNPSAAQKILGRMKDLVGLPPGDHTPDGAGRPVARDTTPEGGLTSPDAEGLNPHQGSGFKTVD